MPGQGEQAAEVLEFWFAKTQPRQWFAKDPAVDALLRFARFPIATRSWKGYPIRFHHNSSRRALK